MSMLSQIGQRQRSDRRAASRAHATPTRPASASAVVANIPAADIANMEIAPDDPLVTYFLLSPGTVDVRKLRLDSPALRTLLAAEVHLVVPLISQGELIGLLNLGERRSQQDYSGDDRGLLNNLAAQAAPAVRVAQLVQEQQTLTRERERIAQELRIARIIQQTLLPKETPALPDWQIATYYQPARAVGGDFYDFLYLADGRLGIVIGDVTDKGVPAALVMATTRSILRSVTQFTNEPGLALERANELLHPDIPPNMFVTCLYAILDTVSGELCYANAGHDLPYCRHSDGSVSELRATGMPLGIMPGMHYEEKTLTLEPGERVLFYSDGLVEAHNPHDEMFSFPHLMSLMSQEVPANDLIGVLLGELAAFTGAGWEQEDDVTMVTLQRTPGAGTSVSVMMTGNEPAEESPDWRLLDSWSLPSVSGNERLAMQRVIAALSSLDLSPRRLEQIQTAVAEATMNAMEHGNHYRIDAPVRLQVMASATAIAIKITDDGMPVPLEEPTLPDLQAKLEGRQSPRGWGLFLIKHLVDELRVTNADDQHTVELIILRDKERADHEEI